MPANELKVGDAKKLPGIFISYRRSDTPDAVGRIYDRLIAEFGKARVFKDVDSIPLGQDFRRHLNDIVGGCAAVLAIIGPKWTDIRNEAGQRRLEDADDFVRIELEAALARNVRVVPVLVGHAPMPGTSQLPSTLSSLAFRQSIEVRPDPDFHNDATRLVSALQQILDPNAPRIVPRSIRLQPWLVALSATAIVAAAALAIPAWKYLQQAPLPETRVDIITPATDQPDDFALSPDGRQIVFVAQGDGAPRLWLRSLASATAKPLADTEGATAPFWSPDSRSIAFHAASTLKRLDLGGGKPQILTVLNNNRAGSGTWNPEGIILIPDDQGSLSRAAATGGAVTIVIKSTTQYSQPGFPQFLPGGQQFLLAFFAGSIPGIYLAALDGRAPFRLTPDTNLVGYLPSGWMLWMRGDALLAQKLDLKRAVLTGDPLTIANDITFASVSAAGLVAYRMGSSRGYRLTWFDRSGVARGTIGDQVESAAAARVSPDGRRVAASLQANESSDIWLLDAGRTSRLTFDPVRDVFPVWSPDGGSIVFGSVRAGVIDLYQKVSSGAGAEELLVSSGHHKIANSWSADGRFLLYFSTDPETKSDLWVLPMAGDRKPFVFLKTAFQELWGQFSPDGRWIAYHSDESGRYEVYVRPFVPPGGSGVASGTAGGKWQVSTQGGAFPVWRADGKELYFINPAGEMMAVPITTTPSTVVPGTSVRLFQARISGGGDDNNRQGRQYDVAPDGRFLINTQDAEAAAQITLIQNWNPDARK
jgi:eukaryotic-like serine/threonine-protein kinase